MPTSPLGWLVLGAIAGFVVVFVARNFAGLQIEPWVAALITTVTATVAAGAGPTERRVEVEVRPDYPVATS